MGPMNMPPQAEPSIAEQAARWVGALERGGEQERTAFAGWLRASPQHVREFLLVTALEKEVGELDLGQFDVEEILARSEGNVVRLGRNESENEKRPLTLTLSPWKGARGRRGWLWGSGLAAAVLAGIVGWWEIGGPGAWESYATAVGEQRTFELEDGSIVELNPHSRVQVRLTERARDIRLLAGEALFKVERDASRPFSVRSGDTVIRAVGTQFAVHRRTGSVTVSVIEGRVEVLKDEQEEPFTLPSPRLRGEGKEIERTVQGSSSVKRMLNAGEEVKIVAAGRIIDRSTVDTLQTQGWRRRSLTFSGDTLAEIAEDFNRYNRAPQIRIQGQTLRDREFSGVFDADDPQSLLDYLARTGELSIERSADDIVIRERR